MVKPLTIGRVLLGAGLFTLFFGAPLVYLWLLPDEIEPSGEGLGLPPIGPFALFYGLVIFAVVSMIIGLYLAIEHG